MPVASCLRHCGVFAFLLLVVAVTSVCGDDAAERYEMARMSLDAGEFDFAADQFRQVLKGHPNHAGAHLGLGIVYMRQHKDAAAFRQLKQYLDLASGAPDRTEVRARLDSLGAKLQAAGDWWFPSDPSAPWRPKTVPQPDAKGFVRIRGGRFLMGGKYQNEQPVHMVALSDFDLMDHAVTNAEYFRFTRTTGHPSPLHWQEDWFWMSQYGDHPVVNISWQDAQAYCAWAGGRLPTEAEWEYACRAGLTQAPYPWGDDPPDTARADFGHLYQTPYATRPVKSYPPNAYGLYDMAGNVWEWVNDWYGENYYKTSPASNPPGPGRGANYEHVRRGGQWRSSPVSLRCARRYGGEPSAHDNGSRAYFGFRCAR